MGGRQNLLLNIHLTWHHDHHSNYHSYAQTDGGSSSTTLSFHGHQAKPNDCLRPPLASSNCHCPLLRQTNEFNLKTFAFQFPSNCRFAVESCGRFRVLSRRVFISVRSLQDKCANKLRARSRELSMAAAGQRNAKLPSKSHYSVLCSCTLSSSDRSGMCAKA